MRLYNHNEAITTTVVQSIASELHLGCNYEGNRHGKYRFTCNNTPEENKKLETEINQIGFYVYCYDSDKVLEVEDYSIRQVKEFPAKVVLSNLMEIVFGGFNEQVEFNEFVHSWWRVNPTEITKVINRLLFLQLPELKHIVKELGALSREEKYKRVFEMKPFMVGTTFSEYIEEKKEDENNTGNT